MQEPLEVLLEDIYTLEPALRDRDAEVRALIASLQAHKPAIKIDEDFARSLRAKLLAAPTVSPLKNQAILSPWMRYLAPVGVMALLLLILVPGYLGQQTPDTALKPATMQSTLAPETSSRSVGSAEDSMMIMNSADAPLISGDDLMISPQSEGVVVTVESVSLNSPGFVVIATSQTMNQDTIIGTSHLLFAGLNEQIEIPLTAKMVSGQTLFATLYYDNGDGVFDSNSDTLVYDPSGIAPFERSFTITP